MAQQITDSEETLSEVNVIPLADLSLVLLIILMVLSPMVSQALIQISAAKAAAAQTQEELTTPEIPIIVSRAPGVLKLNGVVIPTELDFVGKLEASINQHRDKSVLLTAAPDMPHGKVVHLMDLCRRHGATNLIMVKWDPTHGGAQS